MLISDIRVLVKTSPEWTFIFLTHLFVPIGMPVSTYHVHNCNSGSSSFSSSLSLLMVIVPTWLSMIILSQRISIFSESYNPHCYHEPSSVMAIFTVRLTYRGELLLYFLLVLVSLLRACFSSLVNGVFCAFFVLVFQFCQYINFSMLSSKSFNSFFHNCHSNAGISTSLSMQHHFFYTSRNYLSNEFALSLVVLARLLNLIFQESVLTLISTPLSKLIVQFSWSSTFRIQFQMNPWSSCQYMLAQSCNSLGYSNFPLLSGLECSRCALTLVMGIVTGWGGVSAHIILWIMQMMHCLTQGHNVSWRSPIQGLSSASSPSKKCAWGVFYQ